MTRWVLLQHHTPDGAAHLDWMTDPIRAAEPDQRRLITFSRLTARPDVAHDFNAQRLPDHRALYLDYEGPVSEGRGRVARLAGGWCRIHRNEPDRFEVSLLQRDHTRRIVGTRVGDHTWAFHASDDV